MSTEDIMAAATAAVAGTDDAPVDPLAFRTDYEGIRYSDASAAQSAHGECITLAEKLGSNLRSGRKLKVALGEALSRFRESVIVAKTGKPDYLGESQASRDAMSAILEVALKGATEAEKRSEREHVKWSISRYAKLASQARMEQATRASLPEGTDAEAADKAVQKALGSVWKAKQTREPSTTVDADDDATSVESARTVVVQAVERLAVSPHLARAEAVNRMLSAHYVALVAAGADIADREMVKQYGERAMALCKVIGKVLDGTATKRDHESVADFIIGTDAVTEPEKVAA